MAVPKGSESDYTLFADGRFVIKDYNRKKPFSNFLPGIAGLYGIPMWVFYVNRGQGVASFGTKNKDNAILEFYPANKSYQHTARLGFRTFLKINFNGKAIFYEPFHESFSASEDVEQWMEISSEAFSVHEKNRTLGLEASVRYFTVPGEPLAVLARVLTLTNLLGRPLPVQVLDGLPMVNPYGMNEFFIKQMSRTIEAWMLVENLHEKKAPYYRLKVDATDRPEVTTIEEGNFFFSLLEGSRKGAVLLDPIVDPQTIFGSVVDFSYPKLFYTPGTFKVPSHQIQENITPCAFSVASLTLGPKKSKTIQSFFGHAPSVDVLNRYIARARGVGYLERKLEENRQILNRIKSATFTLSSSPVYDLYCGQTYLDNVLRGGLPVRFGDGDDTLIFYAYSRKHGDLERDYNRFLVEPTFFSQGDGNYRDVNQNRRSDGWFDPAVKDINIHTFFNLIQLDGFNPLVLKGARYHFHRSKESKKVLGSFFKGRSLALCEHFLSQSFELGEFYKFLSKASLITEASFARLITKMAPFIAREEKSEHGEGFWVDHWTYNLDLVESYLAIHPEALGNLLFRTREYVFYDNAHRVRPRQEKYFLSQDGKVRQYQAVLPDRQKSHLLAKRDKQKHVVRTRHGQGDIYKTTLFVKMLCLFANKLASLDPEGIGIEMEAEKPSWYDALNGLPGLLGSSLPETCELKRLALFLIQSIDDLELDLNELILLPLEVHDFLARLKSLLDKNLQRGGREAQFEFWDAASDAKEKFRHETRLGLAGREKSMRLGDLRVFLERGREKLDIGLEKAYDKDRRIYPTYFENRVTRYRTERVKEKQDLETKPSSRIVVRPTAFEQTALPLFLEGPVHALKIEKDPARRRELLKAVRESGLYDKKLEMYKVCESLKGASLEIGRACVFSPGWLENESVWLHMEYKFLLELLKSGMTEEFFRDFKKVLVPFQPAARYGRSLLENSSFIVPSVFPDPSLHGMGFVARLSGSTAEFLQMWLYMNIGKRPFILGHDKKLSLRFEPSLASFLFTKEEHSGVYIDRKNQTQKVKIQKNSLAFLFLGKTLVVYHNPKQLDTFGKQRVSVKKITLETPQGDKIEFKGDTVPSPHAARVRDEWVPRIDIELG